MMRSVLFLTLAASPISEADRDVGMASQVAAEQVSFAPSHRSSREMQQGAREFGASMSKIQSALDQLVEGHTDSNAQQSAKAFASSMVDIESSLNELSQRQADQNSKQAAKEFASSMLGVQNVLEKLGGTSSSDEAKRAARMFGGSMLEIQKTLDRLSQAAAATANDSTFHMKGKPSSHLQQTETVVVSHRQLKKAKRQRSDENEERAADSQDEETDYNVDAVNDKNVQQIMAEIEGRAAKAPVELPKDSSSELQEVVYGKHHKTAQELAAELTAKEEARVAEEQKESQENQDAGMVGSNDPSQDIQSTLEHMHQEASPPAPPATQAKETAPSEEKAPVPVAPTAKETSTVPAALPKQEEKAPKQEEKAPEVQPTAQQETPVPKPDQALKEVHRHAKFGSIDVNGDGFIDGIEFQNAMATGTIS